MAEQATTVEQPGLFGRFVRYVTDARAEFAKVTWPTRDELRDSTIRLIIAVSIIGAVIGLMDVAFTKILIDWLPGL